MKRTIFVRSINYACKLIMKVHNGRTEFGYSFETFVCPEKDTETRLYHVLSRHFSLALRCRMIAAAPLFVYEPHHEKTCLCNMRTKKGADQPAHSRSLISAFIVRYLDSIISILAKSKISRLQITSEVEQAGLSHTWSETPKTGFLVTWLICRAPPDHHATALNLFSFLWP